MFSSFNLFKSAFVWLLFWAALVSKTSLTIFISPISSLLSVSKLVVLKSGLLFLLITSEGFWRGELTSFLWVFELSKLMFFSCFLICGWWSRFTESLTVYWIATSFKFFLSPSAVNWLSNFKEFKLLTIKMAKIDAAIPDNHKIVLVFRLQQGMENDDPGFIFRL